jgi:hypothetical protein
MVGLGGVWVEALNDVRVMPADLSKAGVIEEIHLPEALTAARVRIVRPPTWIVGAMSCASARPCARNRIMRSTSSDIVLAAGEVSSPDALIVTDLAHDAVEEQTFGQDHAQNQGL